MFFVYYLESVDPLVCEICSKWATFNRGIVLQSRWTKPENDGKAEQTSIVPPLVGYQPQQTSAAKVNKPYALPAFIYFIHALVFNGNHPIRGLNTVNLRLI